MRARARLARPLARRRRLGLRHCDVSKQRRARESDSGKTNLVFPFSLTKRCCTVQNHNFEQQQLPAPPSAGCHVGPRGLMQVAPARMAASAQRYSSEVRAPRRSPLFSRPPPSADDCWLRSQEVTAEVIQSARRAHAGHTAVPSASGSAVLAAAAADAAAPTLPPTPRKLLDDNQNMILAILENQNAGKLDACIACVGRGASQTLWGLLLTRPPPTHPPGAPQPPNQAPGELTVAGVNRGRAAELGRRAVVTRKGVGGRRALALALCAAAAAHASPTILGSEAEAAQPRRSAGWRRAAAGCAPGCGAGRGVAAQKGTRGGCAAAALPLRRLRRGAFAPQARHPQPPPPTPARAQDDSLLSRSLFFYRLTDLPL